MNKAQFLKALKKTPRNWRVTYEQDIRRGDFEDFCPITAVIVARDQECVPPEDAEEVAPDRLKMKPELADMIVKAADNILTDDLDEPLVNAPKIKALRAELLTACGLKRR